MFNEKMGSLSKKSLVSMRPEDKKDEPLSPFDIFSLLPPKMNGILLEKEAIKIFNLPKSRHTASALFFVASELGIKETLLKKNEVLLALHYISVYGGGYNPRIDRLVISSEPSEKTEANKPVEATPQQIIVAATEPKNRGVGGGLY